MLRSLVWQRIFSVGLVLAVGFLLLVSLVISAAIEAADKFARDMFPFPPMVFEIANSLVSPGHHQLRVRSADQVHPRDQDLVARGMAGKRW